MRTDWKAYLAFSKRDRNVAIILLLLIVLIIISVFYYHPSGNQPLVIITTLDQELAKQKIDTTSNADEQIAYVPSEGSEVINIRAGELFQFDPNTLTAAGFKQLGLQDKIIHTIINYRGKGGHFWKPEDVRKIYGLQKEDADRLIPYIHIAGLQPTFTQKDKAQTNYPNPKPAVIEINTAPIEQWKALPAIGDALANRIVKFRDKIGGFTSVAQVKQTYGLSDSAFRVIEPYLQMASAPQKNIPPEKININTASLNQFKSNSHIPEEIAQAIIIYRSQHGNFSSIEDIKKIVFINDEIYTQVAPYLTIE
ncbi:hypothetical protein FC093_04055 [Ilyomonas limi]|uniref:Helix-hairpin-helix domain-containing protein n=1 Tax=Ilyomonas limi TaxID=2575867 RepID=A0A4U3L6L1_9BACT|nr:helix-hairpin-helix domain-containing protein [Ilyomonas limi]TKK70875.1 hypothetical protein FC093_04055 [Ilyomonas limi]